MLFYSFLINSGLMIGCKLRELGLLQVLFARGKERFFGVSYLEKGDF